MKTTAGIFLILFSHSAFPADVSITWQFDDSPTAVCADGASPAATQCPVTGFEIQQKGSLGGIWAAKPEVGPTIRTKVLTNINPGRQCFRMRTNSNGTYSTETPETCITIPSMNPKSPNTITVVVAVTP